MEVGNEMEIFKILTKYNTQQWLEEGKPLLIVTTSLAYSPRPQSYREEWDIRINVYR